MVQQEVKKKTRIYGTVAALSAMVLVALIFVFGSTPVILPPTEMPTVSAMKTFSSYEELKNYLVANAQGAGYQYREGPLDTKFFGSSPTPAPQPSYSTGATESGSYSTDTYSTTNIQVAGVDEADIVKTDGKYIYTITSTPYSYAYISSTDYGAYAQNIIYIVKADPRDARVVAKITLDNNTYPAGIFLSEDSSRLVVLASQYQVYAYQGEQKVMLYPYQSQVNTFINVYDISDKAYPVLARNFTISGSYFNSRMIGDYVYAVVSQSAYVLENGELPLPAVYKGTGVSDIAPSTIYYSDTAYYANIESNYFTYNTFVSLNVKDDAQEPTNKTLLMGGASTMYVSMNNIYVTYPTYNEKGQYSSIYRVHVDGSELAFEAKGSVPGNVLNQYSMDEYNGYFRIATNWYGGTQTNNVYVLNMSLAVVGRLENLATGENLHSVRFIDDKCYLVTFKKTDPLFVIDLSQPTNPKVLGSLKIPGYSDYLHPYDESHIIGVGKETVEASEGDFAWYQGLKLSLFDVSNVNEPKQLSKYVIGDRGTDSLALSDPKAFLFDKERNLLIIPVDLAQIDKTTVAPGPSAYGTRVWQGVYVFRLTLNSGFEVSGTVTQMENNATSQNGDYYLMYSNYSISRALYIGNTLYTVSNARVQLNSLENMALIAKVDLS